MPRGKSREELAKISKGTQFSGSRAVEAGRKGNLAQQANRPIRQCLKGIATEALYGKPPLSEQQLEPVAKFFGIQTGAVTFAHLAIFKQSIEMSKGDVSAFNLVAAYAGEKPSDRVEVSMPDMSALDEAFNRGKTPSEGD